MASLALERIVRSPSALIDNLPVAIFTCDRNGDLVQFNRRATEFWGRVPELGSGRHRYCGASRLLDAEGADLAGDRTPMAEVLRTGQPARDREVIVERPNGERVNVLVNVDPLFDEHSTLLGGVGCFQDVTELRSMQRQMREGRRVGRRVMEALPAAIYTTDAQGKLLYFNKAAETMWGHAPKLGEQAWCGSWKIAWPDGTAVPHDECPMAVAIKEKRAQVGPEAVAVRPDGTSVPFMPHPTPIFDSKGELVGAVNMLIDLTDQKRADAQQKSLIDELNHRVKNTLSTIQSLAAQTLRNRDGDGREFEGRLMALSRVHDQLTRQAWEWADFAAIARESFASNGGQVDPRVTLEGPPVRLTSRTALALAMVLHELAGNAARYGALSVPDGSVALVWSVGPGKLTIDWREEGGPAVTRPDRRGFGARLLERSVAHELGGRPVLNYAPEGVRCTMEIPLPG
ncbi:MAG: HWE histidine kinase domain-containing protein [Rhizomicrobium sp.]